MQNNTFLKVITIFVTVIFVLEMVPLQALAFNFNPNDPVLIDASPSAYGPRDGFGVDNDKIFRTIKTQYLTKELIQEKTFLWTPTTDIAYFCLDYLYQWKTVDPNVQMFINPQSCTVSQEGSQRTNNISGKDVIEVCKKVYSEVYENSYGTDSSCAPQRSRFNLRGCSATQECKLVLSQQQVPLPCNEQEVGQIKTITSTSTNRYGRTVTSQEEVICADIGPTYNYFKIEKSQKISKNANPESDSSSEVCVNKVMTEKKDQLASTPLLEKSSSWGNFLDFILAGTSGVFGNLLELSFFNIFLDDSRFRSEGYCADCGGPSVYISQDKKNYTVVDNVEAKWSGKEIKFVNSIENSRGWGSWFTNIVPVIATISIPGTENVISSSNQCTTQSFNDMRENVDQTAKVYDLMRKYNYGVVTEKIYEVWLESAYLLANGCTAFCRYYDKNHSFGLTGLGAIIFGWILNIIIPGSGFFIFVGLGDLLVWYYIFEGPVNFTISGGGVPQNCTLVYCPIQLSDLKVDLKVNNEDRSVSNPFIINEGTNQTLLSWTSENTGACSGSVSNFDGTNIRSLSNWSGSLDINGSKTLANLPTGEYLFKVACTGDEAHNTVGQSEVDTVAVKVEPLAPQASCTFFAKPSTIIKPGKSKLEWSCTNANNCEIDSESVNSTAGTKIVQPNKTTTYTLTCNNGQISKTATVTVLKPGYCEINPSGDGCE